MQGNVAEPDQACCEGEGDAAEPVDAGGHAPRKPADGGSGEYRAGWQQRQQGAFRNRVGPDERDQGRCGKGQGGKVQAAWFDCAEEDFARTQYPP